VNGGITIPISGRFIGTYVETFEGAVTPIKKFQLDMLIFVQVYMTIDKFLYLYKVLEEQKREKESTKRKLEASEEKCS